LEADLSRRNIIINDDTSISHDNPFQPTHNHSQAELVVRDLKNSLNSMILALFSPLSTEAQPIQVRWINDVFPFTSPSFQVEVLWKGEWLEILGCGVIKQATLDRAGVEDKIGWAFGLGLDRIAMFLFSIPDIRLLWSTDPRFLGQFESGKIVSFKSFSKFPACYKDVSFWTNGKPFHENDLCDLVRDVAGDMVETVKLIDKFEHAKTGRTSLCYRINYRSTERSLSNEETNEMHAGVTSRLESQLGVEIRL